ncbi:MAG: HNH endonuclease [Opitutaceae bacterium]|nr:HNH endonuclease [Opitutaceae bacterium]
MRRRISNQELIAELQRFSKFYGPSDRTQRNYDKWPERAFCSQTFRTYLGPWKVALTNLGLKYEPTERQRFSDREIEEELRRFAEATPAKSRTLSRFKNWQGKRISEHSISRKYGTWHDALHALEIECPGRSKSKKLSDDDVLEAVERIWRWTRLKRDVSPPSQGHFIEYSKQHADGVSVGTIFNRFGCFEPFMIAFGGWKRGEVTKSDLLTRLQKKPSRTNISKGLRYQLLVDSKFSCSACGPKRKQEKQLHIDHIIPVSKGGTNARENLRVLCEDCNLGRGNRFLE